MNMIADLHLHTFYSNDAFVEPERLLPMAQRMGVGAIALAEHDNIDSWPVISKLAADSPIEVIPAVEIYTLSDELGQSDILAYLFDVTDRRLNEMFDAAVDCGIQQAIDGAARLRELGYAVDLDEVRGYWHQRYPNRAVGVKMMQLWMVAQGWFSDHDAAKAYYAEHVSPTIVLNHKSPHPREVIAAIHDAGGLAVWAHPQDATRQQIELTRSWGLDGLEVHTRGNKGHNDRLDAIAKDLNLLTTGGSDWHQTLDEMDGQWPGGAPMECYHALRQRHEQVYG